MSIIVDKCVSSVMVVATARGVVNVGSDKYVVVLTAIELEYLTRCMTVAAVVRKDDNLGMFAAKCHGIMHSALIENGGI